MREVLDHLEEGVVTVDRDWRITDANAVAAELFDADREALVGTDLREAFPESVESTFQRRYGGDDPPGTEVTYEEYFPDLDAWLSVRTVAREEGGMAVVLRAVTERRRLEDALADRGGELATLTRINALIREIIRGLVGATSREEIESTVCERLAAADLYELAWIADSDRGGLTRRVAAGDHDDVVEGVVTAATGLASGPEASAIESDELRVVRGLATDPEVPEAVRQAAFAHGLQSGVAVPLSYGNTVYGALGVYAAREDAFTDDERTAFATLGETVAFAINAARQRSLLLSDTVVELTLRVTDDDSLFVTASREQDCSLDVEGLVPRGDRSLTCYVTVDAGAAEAVRDRTERSDDVASVRAVDDEGETWLLEVTLEGGSPTLSLVESGAAVRTAAYDSGTGRLVAELAPEGDVREVVDAVREAFPDSELVAKREREETVESARDFRQDLREELTDRQHTVLRTAYFADYFQSPRGSTGEQLAETLGISSPTLHQHLRAAQRKVFAGLFEADRDADAPDVPGDADAERRADRPP